LFLLVHRVWRLEERVVICYNQALTHKEMGLIQKFKALLSQKLEGFEVIAFGSRARGDADADSDLDVLVITEEPETDELFLLVSGCAWEASMDQGAEIVINTVVMSRKEWETGPERFSLLSLAVKREGISES